MLDDYLSLFIHHPIFKTKDAHVFLISVLVLGLARIYPIMSMAPFLGAKVAPAPVKAGFGISLFVLIFPKIFLETRSDLAFNTTLLGFFFKELLVGFILGYLSALPFQLAQSSGTIVDHQRGASNLQAQDPTLQMQSSPIGLLYNYLLIAIFFTIKGPFLFFDVIVQSYDVIPIDHFLGSQFLASRSGFWDESLGLVNHVLKLAVQLASPALLTVLMTDLFLGVSNRLAPQVQIIFLGMPLKALLGLGVLYPSWRFIISQLEKESITFMHTIRHYLELMRI